MFLRCRSGSFGRFGAKAVSACAVLAWVLFWTGLFSAGPVPSALAGTEGNLRITRIKPSGNDVPPGRQIVFEFDRPVVPLGRMERTPSEIPIGIEPALACRWRWLNSSNLACELDERDRMLPATRYSLTVNPGIRTEDGFGLAAPLTHTFITQRPKVISRSFHRWLSPETPQVSILFDQPVRKDSLEAHAYFKTAGGGRVAASASEDGRYEKSAKPGSAWLLSPAGPLSPDRDGALFIEPGVLSTLGPEAGVEKGPVTAFHTLPPFRIDGVHCQSLSGEEIFIRPDTRISPKTRCNPANLISVLFSSPVSQGEREKVAIAPEGGSAAVPDHMFEDADYSRLSESLKKGEPYRYYLDSASVAPFVQYRMQAKANSMRDEFGRPLARAFSMRFATDHRPPSLHLFKSMPVLEKGLDTDAQFLATNLERIDLTYETLGPDGKSPARSLALPGPKTPDIASVIPLGIRKLLSGDSGVVMGRLSTAPPLPEKEYEPRRFFAQVTPFDVHVKLGHFNTLVWITDLRSGEPVPDVTVHIRKDSFKELGQDLEILSEGKTDSNGVAELAGTSKIDPGLKLSETYERDAPGLFLWCRKGSDLALVPLRYDFRVDAEGSNHRYIPSYMRARHGHLRAWGATAQGIYKVGDTVQYKIYVRDQENRRFVPPPSATYTLKVVDPSSKTVHQRDNIVLSEFGAFDGEFPIPKNGAVGYYRFRLATDFAKLDLEPLEVLVSDFTPSPFRVTTGLNGKLFGTGDPVTVSTQAKLHAGGPYGNAETRVTATVEAQPFRPGNPFARDFEFDTANRDEEERPGVLTVFQTQGKLDNNGNLETQFTLADSAVLYGRLMVESSVRDERGKSVASRATAACFGRDRFVGLLQPGWVLEEGKPATVRFVVVDQHGSPVPGVETTVDVERLETRAARVKEAGDAYPTQYAKEWVRVESFSLSSGAEPQAFAFTPKQSGTVRVVARVSDSKGRVHKTAIERWIAGKGLVLWELTEGNLLNIYPEKEEYRVGDTARFFVQNPFPGARALVTVERYGTLERWVKTLENGTEVLEIPVLPDYLPGFYLSATVMSPRVEKPLGPDGEDLGKPAFRTGYAKIEVKDQFKEIEVQCSPDREVYKPRETVKLQFSARPKNLLPDEKTPPIELAVAVLDEAVFDLLRRKELAFDPYRGFYSLDDLDLANYNLIMQLVGREKLEKKGASPAAGAGFDLSMRSVFKFVSYWNPSVPVDAEGKANVEFAAPDNLTGWRVLAMAVTPGDRMGLGQATFQVNQSTEIRPVLPNQVVEGDVFSAGFSVMNRTGETRNIEVKITASGQCTPVEAEPSTGTGGLEVRQTIAAEPYKRYVVRLSAKASCFGEISFLASAGNAADRDSLRQTIKVLPKRAHKVAAAYGSVLSGEHREKISFPEKMLADSSFVRVTLSPTMLGGLGGAFQYMQSYPFECWEQKISRAVLAGVCEDLASRLPGTVIWEGSKAEAEKTLSVAAEFQAPNGGMAFYQPRDGYVSPFLSAFTARAFNWLRETGNKPPVAVEEKLQRYLLELLKRDDANEDGVSRAGLSDVRALALAALAERGKVSRADCERHFKKLPGMSLFGKAAFLEALTKVEGTRQMRQAVLRDILSHSDETSGTIRFTETAGPGARQILASPQRDNAAILMALLAFATADPSGSELKDIPEKLMQTINAGRGGRDRWASTQENLYAVLASVRYGKMYETVPPKLEYRALLDRQLLGRGRFESFSDRPATFEYWVRDEDRGRAAAAAIQKEGEGRLYYETRLSYSPEQIGTEAVNAGIEIHREYSVERNGKWVLLQDSQDPQNLLEVRTGELVRVDLFVSLPAERFFVAVEDPVPGGFEPVQRELSTSSEIDAGKADSVPAGSYRNRYGDWRSFGVSRWSFYHKELRHSAARFYSERLSPGHYVLSYTAQAIAPGRFSALPARAEEMYDPDVRGTSAPATVKVEPAP